MNELWGDFHFLRPLWLLAIPLAVLLWFGLQRAYDPLRGWRASMDSDLLSVLKTTSGTSGRFGQVVLLLAWIVAAIAVAGPTWKPEPSPFADDPVPVMVVLRAAETMDLSDLVPSRMERARLKIADFAELRKGQPTGLVAYAGSAHLVLPPTRDTEVVASMAANISPDVMPTPGDDLASAIRLAEKTIRETGGSLVVFADQVDAASDSRLSQLKEDIQASIAFLAVARAGTTELDTIRVAGRALKSNVIQMSVDSSDVESLARWAAQTPRAVSDAEGGVRWAEAGWYLVPLLAALTLFSFRREQTIKPEEIAP